MRLIDADALKTKAIKCETFKLTDTPVFFKAVGTKEIDKAPTVDAVEVVRCGECKHRYTPCCGLYYGSANSVNYFSEHGEDFYCSYGERKEVGE